MNIKTSAEEFAAMLLRIGAIKINLTEPYTLASGWKSPIYCNVRKLLFHPNDREEVVDILAREINRSYYDKDIIIAGVATGAIGIGVLVAEKLKCPFVYIRSKAKDHGTESQIECGELDATHEVLVIEDLISTGKSSLRVVDAIRATGARVLGMAALFTYEFPVAADAFKAAGVIVNTLSNYRTLIGVAEEKKLIQPEQKEMLAQWRLDPANWNPVVV